MSFDSPNWKSVVLVSVIVVVDVDILVRKQLLSPKRVQAQKRTNRREKKTANKYVHYVTCFVHHHQQSPFNLATIYIDSIDFGIENKQKVLRFQESGMANTMANAPHSENGFSISQRMQINWIWIQMHQPLRIHWNTARCLLKHSSIQFTFYLSIRLDSNYRFCFCSPCFLLLL